MNSIITIFCTLRTTRDPLIVKMKTQFKQAIRSQDNISSFCVKRNVKVYKQILIEK